VDLSGAVTLTETVQTPLTPPVFAWIVPPVKPMEVAPAEAVTVGLPHPVVLTAGVDAIVIPVGRASAKDTPVRAVALIFVRVKVKVDEAPELIGSGEKFFEIVGASRLRQPEKVTLST